MESTQTILVIDDDQATADFLAEFLHDEGYNVVTTDSGDTGLELVYQNAPDLVLWGLPPPGLPGATLCNVLHAYLWTRAIPFVLMSTSVLPKHAASYGFSAFLLKPFKLDALSATIQTNLPLRARTV